MTTTSECIGCDLEQYGTHAEDCPMEPHDPPQPLNAEPPQGPVEGRGAAEIRADLATCDQLAIVPWPAAARRLLADVPQLLAEVEAAHRFERSAAVEREALLAERALGQHLAYISRTVTASYPDGMDAELVMRRRVGKVWVEAGELGDAIEGWTGENPRKGTYAARHDVVKELIDCASAALCAVEYMTGDKGDSLALLAAQVAGNAQRLSESIPDACGPSPAVLPEKEQQ